MHYKIIVTFSKIPILSILVVHHYFRSRFSTRLLVEGVREWYRGVQHRPVDSGNVATGRQETAPRVLGALSGATGQGKALLVQALRRICGALPAIAQPCSAVFQNALYSSRSAKQASSGATRQRGKLLVARCATKYGNISIPSWVT